MKESRTFTIRNFRRMRDGTIWCSPSLPDSTSTRGKSRIVFCARRKIRTRVCGMKSSVGKIRLSLTVFLEDSAGLLGAVLAFVAIFLGQRFKNPYFDPIASILIGLVLAVMAVFLGRESGALLIGERTNRGRIRRVNEVIQADDAVERVGDILTMQLGPEQVLLNVEIQFQKGLTLAQLESAIDRIEAKIRQAEPTIQRIFIEAESFKQRGQSPRAA